MLHYSAYISNRISIIFLPTVATLLPERKYPYITSLSNTLRLNIDRSRYFLIFSVAMIKMQKISEPYQAFYAKTNDVDTTDFLRHV